MTATALAHGHRQDVFLLANARRICSRAYARSPNWVLAAALFATGSQSARQLCRDAGVDPDGMKIDIYSTRNQQETKA